VQRETDESRRIAPLTRPAADLSPWGEVEKTGPPAAPGQANASSPSPCDVHGSPGFGLSWFLHLHLHITQVLRPARAAFAASKGQNTLTVSP